MKQKYFCKILLQIVLYCILFLSINIMLYNTILKNFCKIISFTCKIFYFTNQNQSRQIISLLFSLKFVNIMIQKNQKKRFYILYCYGYKNQYHLIYSFRIDKIFYRIFGTKKIYIFFDIMN